MTQQDVDERKIYEQVREAYTAVATRTVSCCGTAAIDTERVARAVGYSDADLSAVPAEANLGVGCGNPAAIAGLRPGDAVLDLGCGAGFDVFLAARRVGATGRVIGVDMTDAMLERARANAYKGGFTNVEFRSGRIEQLPVDDESIDVVISNCVINLSPDKRRVFREAFRVLRPGGRLAVSDLVLDRPLPPALRECVAAWVGCVAGAMLRRDYLEAIGDAGFRNAHIVEELDYAGVVDVQTPEIRSAAERAGLSSDDIAMALASLKSLKISAER